MKCWRMRLAMMVCIGIFMSCAAGLAEIADWARAQEAAADQQVWADLYGAEVDATEMAEDITKKCKIRVSEGEKSKLTNGRVGSPWKFSHSDAWIGIQLPEGVTPGAIRVEWLFDPKGYELIEYDANQTPLRTRTQADTFPGIYTLYPLLEETRSIRLNMTSKDQSVSNLAIYSAGVLPAGVQTWLPPVEKADMMVFSTHQDDEVIFLGGTIPYSDVVCKRPTITVYMTNCNRDRRREALECLWEMGTRHYPEFINLEDEKVSSIEKGVKLWGGQENILKEIVARIRRYKPEVIVTQDLDGEYGHNQHKIMARAMQPAIEAAADPNQFPDSFNQYGAWQVKKLYLHLYKENQIRMDWTTPQPACGGLSLLEVARKGMEKHASQTKYYSVKDGGEYDNALYGLALTKVGEDVEKNDFFENIERGASAAVLSAEGETAEAAAPTGEDSAWDDAWESAGDISEDDAREDSGVALESEPTDLSASEADPDPEAAVQGDFDIPQTMAPGTLPQTTAETGGGGRGLVILGVGALIAALGVGGWALTARGPAKKRGKSRKKKSAKGRKSGANTAKKGQNTAPKRSETPVGRHAGKHAGKHQTNFTGKY